MTLDEQIAAHRRNEPLEPDDRKWIFIEIIDGQINWITHNFPLVEAFGTTSITALDMRDEMKAAP